MQAEETATIIARLKILAWDIDAVVTSSGDLQLIDLGHYTFGSNSDVNIWKQELLEY